MSVKGEISMVLQSVELFRCTILVMFGSRCEKLLPAYQVSSALVLVLVVLCLFFSHPIAEFYSFVLSSERVNGSKQVICGSFQDSLVRILLTRDLTAHVQTDLFSTLVIFFARV